jgi:hypothetical protein
MKKIIRIILVISISLTSCSEEFLDKSPLDQFGEDAVWADLYLMETFVNNIYYNIYHGFCGKIGMQMFCDEAMRTSDRGAGNVTKSLVSPSDYLAFKEVGQQKLVWNNLYKNVRACNLFLENIEKNTYDDAAFLKRMTGEVYFLRAYIYHTLAFQYGGVPLIDKAYTLKDDPLIARNSFEDIINFIVSDCDKAADMLGLTNTDANKGRATKGAALALKARVLLYAASDLYSNSLWASGYSNPEYISYTSGDRASRWRAAKNAAYAVIDLNAYDLYKANPAPEDDIAKNYEEMFLSKETSEDIFVRFFTQKSMESTETYHPGLHNSPGGYHGHGSNNPIGQAVDAFQMKDGTPFDWNNPAHKAHPYVDREPRFYASILYDGAVWRSRPDDVVPLDPIGIIQTGYYELNADGSVTRSGIDTRGGGAVDDWNGTGSGYYQRKYIDPSYVFMYEVQESPWRHIRYTEILLSYAEACNELGEDAEAVKYINMIRKRAGLPDINSTGDQLRKDIRHERYIELMFEGQRYWDIRRWMIAPEVIVNAQGIDIRYKYGATDPVYTPIKIQDREWNDRSYFMPILLDEMNKNDLLVQNPLY